MRDEVTTDVDREIQRLLEVDPSPEFQARVRMRLSEEPHRPGLGIGWIVSGAAGLAAVAVLAMFISSRDDVAPRAPVPVAPAAQTAAAAEPAPLPAEEQAVALAPPAPIGGSRTEMVLVPAAEREAFRRFVRAATENGLAYAVAREIVDDAPLSVPEIAIEPIVIAPIDTTAE
jgi:hypothetical protein